MAEQRIRHPDLDRKLADLTFAALEAAEEEAKRRLMIWAGARGRAANTELARAARVYRVIRDELIDRDRERDREVHGVW